MEVITASYPEVLSVAEHLVKRHGVKAEHLTSSTDTRAYRELLEHALVGSSAAAAAGVCLSGRRCISARCPAPPACQQLVACDDVVPAATLFTMRGEERTKLSTAEIFGPDQTVVAFGVPGAFTPG